MEIKFLSLDGLTTFVDKLKSVFAAKSHDHNDLYDAKGSANSALASAKEYADSASITAATTIKNDLLNGAGEAYDTLKELGELIDENHDAIDALETVATGKADKVHIHEIADVNGLQVKLDEIASTIIQPDWDETDETAMDFIKNKPDESDALELVTEMGFIEPTIASDGSIYTDENNNIYTLI